MAEKSTVGTFCWNELMTKDAVAAKAFYAKLFGWKMADMPIGDGVYTILKRGDKDAGGLMQVRPDMGPVPSHWMAYVEVDDVDAATRKAAELGGRIHVAGRDIPGIGRFGVLEDPTGAMLSVFKPAQPAPPKRPRRGKVAKRTARKTAKRGRRR